MLKETYVAIDRAKEEVCLVDQRLEELRAEDEALTPGELKRHSYQVG